MSNDHQDDYEIIDFEQQRITPLWPNEETKKGIVPSTVHSVDDETPSSVETVPLPTITPHDESLYSDDNICNNNNNVSNKNERNGSNNESQYGTSTGWSGTDTSAAKNYEDNQQQNEDSNKQHDSASSDNNNELNNTSVDDCSSSILNNSSSELIDNNIYWGHEVCKNRERCTRFTFQNINGIRPSHLDVDCDKLSEINTELQTSMANFVETKINWRYDNIKNNIKQKLGKGYKNSTLATAHCDVPVTEIRQAGGVASLITDRLTGRLEQIRSDKMGRWVAVTLHGIAAKSITVITAYMITQRTPTGAGPTTSCIQQWNYLRTRGHADPNPRKKGYADLEALVHSRARKQ